jgi:hypothetical protein
VEKADDIESPDFLNPEKSGFQPTTEPTGFQPVVVQFLF